ncbi:hypothetical protein DASC09_045020 [Saccharomycopsis crataegensis]|uniref:MPN domain-containing protein n=1 Tax=Saccharomycopsis crataegensis TaxID=43959 RepID=A0AAV5QRZ9_9ASCO|nr:hypothetical protein DASC09_045020 [Saccharomycopsis crataegensis]
MSKEYTAPNTETVQVESSVVLKIVKHASKHFPTPVSGPLLGLDTNQKVLNVSHAFPFPTIGESNEGYSYRIKSNQKYVHDLTEQMKIAGHATQFVGWYQSTTSANFLNHFTIDNLLGAQINNNANSILFVHDASKLKKGILSLRAFRLSENFVKAYLNNGQSNKFTRKILVDNELNYKNFLVELPIQIHNSQLISLFLNDLKLKINEYHLDDLNVNNLIDLNSDEDLAQKENKNTLLENFGPLNLSGLEDSTLIINKLVDSIDDYNYDLNNFNYYQRQLSREMAKVQQWKQKAKQDGKPVDLENDWKSLFKLPTEPSRYDNLLISASIDGFCDDLDLGCVSELAKTFTVKGGFDN